MIERTLDRQALLRELQALDGITFEQYIADIYRHNGHHAKRSGDGGDGGLDVRVIPKFKMGHILVQAKCLEKTKVRSPDVQSYSGLYAEPGLVSDAVIITTGSLTDDAWTLANRRGVTIVAEDDIVDWILERDPQLVVTDEYVDVATVVDEEWAPPTGYPTLRAPALIAIGALALLVTGAYGVTQLPTLKAGIVPSPVPHTLSFPFLFGAVFTVGGVGIALEELRTHDRTVLTVLTALLATGHCSGLLAGLVWWAELFRDAAANAAHTVPSYTLPIPGSEQALSIPAAAIQFASGAPILASGLLIAVLIWVRDRERYEFTPQ